MRGKRLGFVIMRCHTKLPHPDRTLKHRRVEVLVAWQRISRHGSYPGRLPDRTVNLENPTTVYAQESVSTEMEEIWDPGYCQTRCCTAFWVPGLFRGDRADQVANMRRSVLIRRIYPGPKQTNFISERMFHLRSDREKSGFLPRLLKEVVVDGRRERKI